MADAMHDTIARVWKEECGRLVGAVTRIVRDVGLAEEIAHDAFLAALEVWPTSGVPARPGAWLMTTAKHRALNLVRHARMADRKHAAIEHELPGHVPLDELEAAFEAAMDADLHDDVLRLIFTACHPLLSQEARVTLTLRLVGGLTTEEIARAFLTTEPTIGQRITRAKRTLAEAHVPFEVPRGEALGTRLASVLEVVYLIFNEGYSATAGEDVLRPALVDEALRLGALLASLAPEEPEVHALHALMLLQASRLPARTDARGEPVLLLEQDRGRWDRARIDAGLAALARAEALGGSGAYWLQAAIAACHARADVAAATDWAQIAALYGELASVAPSPVVELNRAVAIARAEGPAAGLARLDVLAAEPALARYHLLPSARAELLEQLGRRDEARLEWERAATLTKNLRQQERLRQRAAACAH